MNKKLIAVIMLVIALIVQSIPAFAVDEALEGTTEPTITTEPTEPPEDSAEPTPVEDGGEGTDTLMEESPSEGPETDYTATTVEELIQAIEQAEAGATIGIGCEIVCPAGTVLGDIYKQVTLRRTAPEGRISAYSPDGTGNVIFQNIMFDGYNVEATNSFIQASISTMYSECRFFDCTGGAVEAETGHQFFILCTFENNTAQYGAHIRINSGTADINTCVFSGGTATIRGGAIAIFTDQEVNLDQCTIMQNKSNQHGGGIWNKGVLTITQCMIHGNTAPWEPDDIANDYQGRLALMDNHQELVDLYESHGLTPNKWSVDTYEDEYSEKSHMVFSMTFVEDSEPEPSPEPTPGPEPEPDPEPTPEPTPDPVQPSTPSNGDSRPSSRPAEQESEEPQEITLTNGKAVLTAPEALFWMGYEVGQGGGAEAVTRAEFAALMVSMMDEESLKEFSTTAAPFGDVQPGSGSAPAIATANNADIMVGCGAGAFKPDRELTWGELITVLSRFSGDDTPPEVYTGGHWAKDAINIAISLDWLEYSEDFDPGEIVTCSEIITFVQGVFQWAEIQS